MERILGREMGDFIRALHEEHGVVFHLKNTAGAIDGKAVRLSDGGTIEADLIVAGLGVRSARCTRRGGRAQSRSRRRRRRPS